MSVKVKLTLPYYKQAWFKWAIMIALSAFTFVWLTPVIWTFVTSLRGETAIQRNLVTLIPAPFTTEHWSFLLSSSNLSRWFLNSIFISSSITVLVLIINSLAAFAFARLEFRGKRILYFLVLAGLMVPFQAIFIPLYLLFSDLGLINTYLVQILPGLPSAFAVFLMVQFFKGIPRDLEEAALIDGAGYFTIYIRIILPLARPVLTALAIFTFLGSWNSYLWPLVTATDPSVMPVTVGIKHLYASMWNQTLYGLTMASAAITAFPPIIFFWIFQRQIISGIQVSSGIK